MTLESMAEALEAKGVSAAEFFSRVSATVTEIPENIALLRADGIRTEVTVRCVFNRESSAILGHLARFRTQSDTSVIDTLLDQIAEARQQLRVLSKREHEILNMVYEGRTNKAISIAANISEKTVEKHRARIVMKLGLSCTAMLVRLITVARMLPSPFPEEADTAPTTGYTGAAQRSSSGFSFQPPTN